MMANKFAIFAGALSSGREESTRQARIRPINGKWNDAE